MTALSAVIASVYNKHACMRAQREREWDRERKTPTRGPNYAWTNHNHNGHAENKKNTKVWHVNGKKKSEPACQPAYQPASVHPPYWGTGRTRQKTTNYIKHTDDHNDDDSERERDGMGWDGIAKRRTRRSMKKKSTRGGSHLFFLCVVYFVGGPSRSRSKQQGKTTESRVHA